MLNNKLFYFFDKKRKKNLFLLMFCMFIASIFELIGLSLIFPISGLALDSSNTQSNFFINNLTSFFEISQEQVLNYALLLFFLFYFVKIFFLIWYMWFENKFIYSFKENLSSRLFEKYINQNFNFFHGRNSSEFLRNITFGVDHVAIYLMSALKLLLENLVLLAILGFLTYMNWLLTLVIVLTFFSLSAAYMFFFKDKLNTWGLLRQVNLQKRIQFMQEGFEGVKSIKLLGREIFFFNKFKKHNLDLSAISIKADFFKNIPRLLFELLGIAAIIVVFFVLFDNKKSSAEIIQMIAVYAVASFRILPSVNKILQSLQTMKFNYPSLDKIYFEFKSFKNEKINLLEKFSFKKNILVNIKNFKHRETSKFEMKDIRFTINKGQKIGIIGASGSGKSTLIDIMTGILQPNDGDVFVDGISIFSNLRGWQNLIGFVPQKIFILDDTLKKNILFGLDEKNCSDEKIYKLIKKMNLEILLNRLPDGLNGKLGEKGLNLSGGEIQRIGICRALIYDPEILFLDEATSALDTFTETQILNELSYFKEKTIVSIAHRINTLRNCDKVYSIDNGKIVDEGNFSKFK